MFSVCSIYIYIFLFSICYIFVSPQLLLRFLAIILTASAANPWVLIPAVFVMTAHLILRWYYLKTSREIKRLEAIGMLSSAP